MKPMHFAVRLGLGQSCLCVGMLLMAMLSGTLPDRTGAILDGRRVLCEAIAVHASLAAQKGDLGSIEGAVRSAVARNPEIRSAVVCRADGSKVLEAVDAGGGTGEAGVAEGQDEFCVPVARGTTIWGSVRLRFAPLATRWMGIVSGRPETRFLVSFAVLSFCVQSLYLWSLLGDLGVGRGGAIPDRVRATLDTLAEGVLLLDGENRIAMANQAFARRMGRAASDLEGCKAQELPWLTSARRENEVPSGDGLGGGPAEADADLPWMRAMREGTRQFGKILEVQTESAGRCTLSVNATPIVDDEGEARGVLATFDDLTSIERKNEQLRKALDKLRRSRGDVRRQNRMLKDLSTLDAPTLCLNREALMDQFEALCQAPERSPGGLACVLIELRWHATPDAEAAEAQGRLLARAAAALRATARTEDVIGRLADARFCALLPGMDVAAAAQAAERLREAVAVTSVESSVVVTVTAGSACRGPGAETAEAMLDEAERSLTAGRRVAAAGAGRAEDASETEVPVSYHAVTSLVSALAYRDVATAEHSRRVADLCVAAARGMMSERDCYLLEIAALLHDIGKLGVPDAVLQKPGPLDEQEWRVMSTHDRLGVEIISAAFASPGLSEIVRTHHAWFGGNPRDPELPSGEAIPVGARLLAIADSYDAMVSDRVYRKGRSKENAIEELRRCAGTQFDPALVERFAEAVGERQAWTPIARASISKRTAFKIGLQIEKLAEAMDDNDGTRLGEMAARLRATAEENGIAAIAEAAERLERSLATPGDWYRVLELTCELMELCRSTQSSYLETCRNAEDETRGSFARAPGRRRAAAAG